MIGELNNILKTKLTLYRIYLYLQLQLVLTNSYTLFLRILLISCVTSHNPNYIQSTISVSFFHSPLIFFLLSFFLIISTQFQPFLSFQHLKQDNTITTHTYWIYSLIRVTKYQRIANTNFTLPYLHYIRTYYGLV